MIRKARSTVSLANGILAILGAVLVLVFLPYAIGGACVVFVLWIVVGALVGVFRGVR